MIILNNEKKEERRIQFEKKKQFKLNESKEFRNPKDKRLKKESRYDTYACAWLFTTRWKWVQERTY